MLPNPVVPRDIGTNSGSCSQCSQLDEQLESIILQQKCCF